VRELLAVAEEAKRKTSPTVRKIKRQLELIRAIVISQSYAESQAANSGCCPGSLKRPRFPASVGWAAPGLALAIRHSSARSQSPESFELALDLRTVGDVFRFRFLGNGQQFAHVFAKSLRAASSVANRWRAWGAWSDAICVMSSGSN